MSFYGDIIGHPCRSQTLYYAGSDNEKNLKKNIKTMPDDWYFRNLEITYKYNKHGHRSIEIEDLDFNNYILFLGDSHTEGIGLELETTYPYLVSQKLNLPYYNLGLGASGIDVMCYNLSIWLSKFPKPKFIVLNWSDPTRFITKTGRQSLHNFTGIWSSDVLIQELIKYGEFSGYFETRFLMQSNIIRNLLNFNNIKNANFTIIPTLTVPGIHVDFLPGTDLARDLSHYGIKSNLNIADYVVTQYTDKYLNARFTDDIRGQE